MMTFKLTNYRDVLKYLESAETLGLPYTLTKTVEKQIGFYNQPVSEIVTWTLTFN